MSVQEFFDFQQNVLLERLRSPMAWLLKANPVWGSYETVNRIALFDTLEQAEAYLQASKLPEPATPGSNTTEDGYSRSFRPDSLLFDYNDEKGARPMIVPAILWHDYQGVLQNPIPPSGPAPDIRTRDSSHIPRYGKDYDQGFGGPYSNMNQVVPQ